MDEIRFVASTHSFCDLVFETDLVSKHSIQLSKTLFFSPSSGVTNTNAGSVATRHDEVRVCALRSMNAY